ncbi:MAG TPA: preprotein translocase subunit SecE [Sedimentisphaerales bacterium]|nr:preprotein translocase subunit SecE [Sedimentisphaerales bacterium]
MAFTIYKKGQGKYTRLYSAFGAAVVALLGCIQLYNKLVAAELGLSNKTSMWVSTMVPVVVFAALSLMIFWIVNRPATADFMISAEGEMKKVSWASRREIAVSTFIVISVVILMATMLGIADFSFQLFFQWLLNY